MHRLRLLIPAAALLGLLVGPNQRAAAIDWAGNEEKLQFTRKDTQTHFWLSATGTYCGTQVFRSLGVPLGRSVTLSALGIFSVGVAKEFLHDQHPSKNDLQA